MFVFAKRCVLLLVVLLQTVNLLQYVGEEFPVKFLGLDRESPTDSDMELYIDKLKRMTKYLTYKANETDINQALSCFMSVAILKRTIQDYSNKIEPYVADIKELIHRHLNIIAHYRYDKKGHGLGSIEYRMAKILQDVTSSVYSLRKFNQGVYKKWLLKFTPINDFAQAMDRLTLPKEEYVMLVQDIGNDTNFRISGPDSDICLSRMAHNIDVLDNITLHPCNSDDFCRQRIFVGPSVAYSLTHRQINNMLYLHTRRCYHHSPAYEHSHLDMLCAAMYREAVYLARRGYFARDVFMEHVAFCGQLGYEEVHRPVWFRKVAKWIDERGCMQEDSNFEFNRTKLLVASAADDVEVRNKWRNYYEIMAEDCHHHQMAVAAIVLANGIRHAAHYKEDPIDNLINYRK